MNRKWFTLLLAVMMFLSMACTQHRVEVEPVEVKPIHITIDVNVKIEREIDDYFGDLFEQEEQIREQQANENQE
jgi:hypothetical protein